MRMGNPVSQQRAAESPARHGTRMRRPPTTSAIPRAGRGHALTSFLATRAIVFLAAWLGLSQLPRLYHKGPLTEFALAWDGAWYVGIAQAGYRLAPPPGASNLAFPPLLPLLTHLLGALLGAAGFTGDDRDYGTWALAGLLISNLAFLAALYVL